MDGNGGKLPSHTGIAVVISRTACWLDALGPFSLFPPLADSCQRRGALQVLKKINQRQCDS